MVEDLDHPWRIYARQVRWAACGVVCILILALVIGTVWFRVADVHRREAQRRIDISLDMVRQFEGTSLGHPPFGNAPERFVRVLEPSLWPNDPVPADRIPGIKMAIGVFNSMYPYEAVTFKGVKMAYGRDFERNVTEGWKQNRKELRFVSWCRQPAHVVYRRDVFDGNHLVHRRGERFEGKISNYEYVIHRDSAYEELEFVSDPAKGK